MMYFVVIAMAATVLAEPPISKSYLPPSPNGSGGYPKGPQGFHGSQGLQGPQSFQGPQGAAGPFPGASEVVAARSIGQGREQTLAEHGTDFARNSLHDHVTASHSEGYDSAFGRNGETGELASYNFGYMVNDHDGTEFGHHEERQEERAQGEYHVVLPDGRKQTVSYEADERGFKPHISYQHSDDLAHTGYDSNANTRDFQNGARGNHGNGVHGHDLHGNGIHGHDLHGNGIHGNARSNGY